MEGIFIARHLFEKLRFIVLPHEMQNEKFKMQN